MYLATSPVTLNVEMAALGSFFGPLKLFGK